MTYRLSARRSSVVFSVLALAAGLSVAAGSGAAQAAHAMPAKNTGWRVIRTIGPNNTILNNIVAFHHSSAWLGGSVLSPTHQFFAAVYRLSSGRLHQIPLTKQLGTGVNGLSATSTTNVWASLAGVLGGQVDRLTTHGWHPYPFAISSDDILMSPVVTLGPKDTWVLDEDFTTHTAYGYQFNGSKWHRQVLPAFPDANSGNGYVSGSAGNNIWALISASNQPASMRYNGSKWLVVKFPANLASTGTTLGGRQILALSPKDVWATIGTSTTTGVGPVVLLHWTGRKWSKITGKLPKASLSGPVASDGNGGVWLSAVNAADTVPLILHFSRGHWSTFHVPTDKGKLLSIQQLTLIPGTRSVIGTATIAGSGESTDGTAVIKSGP